MKALGNPFLGVGFDMWALGLESSTVIAQRSLRWAAGRDLGGDETSRMITEKIDAALDLQRLAFTGGLGLEPVAAASKAVRLYRRKVRANRRRLARG